MFVVCFLIEKQSKGRKISLRWIFSAFLILYVTVLRRGQQDSFVRLIPFQTVSLRTLWTGFLNIVLFLPFGYETWRICSKQNNLRKIRQSLIYGFIFSCFAELLQLVLKRGVFDTEDFIFNTTGALMGGILCEFLVQLMRSKNGDTNIR